MTPGGGVVLSRSGKRVRSGRRSGAIKIKRPTDNVGISNIDLQKRGILDQTARRLRDHQSWNGSFYTAAIDIA